MQLEEGSIIEGKVTGIQKFGAFVDIGGGKSGLVHISEVSPVYVNDINDFLKVGQTVRVKVVSIADNGKISLSVKKAMPPVEGERPPRRAADGRQSAPHGGYDKDKDKDTRYVHRPAQKKPQKKEGPNAEALEYAEYAYEPRNTVTDADFEDMLSKFKSSSEDRMSDLKRTMDMGAGKKRGSRRK